MPPGDDLFDQDAELWWSADSHCALLNCLVPARLDYLRRMMAEACGTGLGSISVLDVGCGGGLFAEEVARLGCQVSGVDVSERSIEVARSHAATSGLSISYHVASGENLPFGDGHFDVVYCCDVLEHVDDPDGVIAQSARVLKDGGLYLFDTINRTWLSKILMIGLVQEWLRIVPGQLHEWQRFITPKELRTLLKRYRLQPVNITGLAPAMGPIASIKRLFAFLKVKKGSMTYAELGREMLFRPSRCQFLNYMGHAVKRTVA